MADAMPLDPDKGAARDRLGIARDVHCLALLPGSRAEVEMLSADFLKTAQILRKDYPDLQVVVPLVNARRREQFERIKAERRRILRCICWMVRRAMRSPAMPPCWLPEPRRWSACWPSVRWWLAIV
jgi:lipid-A-disaccharide synthase